MTWRLFRKRLLVLTAAGLIVAAGVVWFVGGNLVAPANRMVGLPPPDFPAETVSILSKSGTTLAGWHCEQADASATVILLHPIRADRRAMLSRAKLFRELGFSTLLIDLQAHGESPGDNITIGHLEKYDVLAAVEFVRQTAPAHKIVIVGSSLGGGATLLAQPEVDVIVLESVFPAVAEAVHNRIQMRLGPLHHVFAPLLLMQLRPRLGVSADQIRPIDRIAEIGCPILIAAGDGDEHTTIDETRRLFAAASEPKKLVVFEGAKHVDLFKFDQEKYEREVVGFVFEMLEKNGPD